MAKWQDDPELFLYIGHENGNVLHIWRCKRMSSSMPLQRQDFTDEIPVPGSKYLVRKGFSWPPASLKKLEEYMAPRHFLINCQGLVYVELHKFGADENIDSNQRIYLRLLDVVNMDAFGLKAAPKVPFRMVEYMEDGTIADVCPSPNEMKLSAEVEALQQQLVKEACDKQALEERVVDLEGKVESLGKAQINNGWECVKPATPLQESSPNPADPNATDDLTWTCVVPTSQPCPNSEKCAKHALAKRVAELEAKNMLLIEGNTNLIVELTKRSNEVVELREKLRIAEPDVEVKRLKEREAKLTTELANATKKVTGLQQELEKEKREKKALEDKEKTNQKEDWMSECTCRSSFVKFKDLPIFHNTNDRNLQLLPYDNKGNDRIENTNIRSNKIYRVSPFTAGEWRVSWVLDVESLTNGADKALFYHTWGKLITPTTTYACTGNHISYYRSHGDA